MILSFAIRQLLQDELGRELRHPSDAEHLVLDIESKTKAHIGVNTIKRLLGFINDQRTPRASTLDIIARYLHKERWSDLEPVGSDVACTEEISPKERTMTVGTRLDVTIGNNHLLILRYVGNCQFVVEQSNNSSILAGTIITVAQLTAAGQDHWKIDACFPMSCQ